MDSPKVNVAPKRKGGRTSRAAMQKNKTRRLLTKVPKLLLENPQESSNNGSKGPVLDLMPSTPTLENEALSSAVSWQQESSSHEIMLDECGIDIDHHGCSSNIYTTTSNYSNNNNVYLLPSPPYDPEGGIMSGCGEEREDVAEFPYEERENGVPDDLKETYEGGGPDGGTFWVDDDIIMREELVDPVGDYVSLGEKEKTTGNGGGATISEERGCGTMKMAISDQDLEPTAVSNYKGWLNGEQYYSSCTASSNSYTGEGNWEWGLDLDFDWDWEFSLQVQGHELWGDEEEEKMVGWLWDINDGGECSNKMGGDEGIIISDVDEKKEALVAWLLS